MGENQTYQIKDVQTYLSEECMNVFYYRQTSGEGDATALSDAFVATVLPAIQAIQNIGLVHTRLDILNYDDDEDFVVTTLGTGYEGDVSGEAMPRFVTWAYRLNRASRNVRNGAKRFAGVSENWQTGGVANSGTPLTTLEALADILGARLDGDNGNQYELRIGSFVGGPGTPLPAEISSVTYVTISTQNSRKR